MELVICPGWIKASVKTSSAQRATPGTQIRVAEAVEIAVSVLAAADQLRWPPQQARGSPAAAGNPANRGDRFSSRRKRCRYSRLGGLQWVCNGKAGIMPGCCEVSPAVCHLERAYVKAVAAAAHAAALNATPAPRGRGFKRTRYHAQNPGIRVSVAGSQRDRYNPIDDLWIPVETAISWPCRIAPAARSPWPMTAIVDLPAPHVRQDVGHRRIQQPRANRRPDHLLKRN
jgi:hypothetical protein